MPERQGCLSHDPAFDVDCAACWICFSSREIRAKKALISDLLDACKAALPHHQGGHSEVGAKLKAAIAKAEAE